MTDLIPLIGIIAIVVIAGILSNSFVKKFPQYSEKMKTIDFIFYVPLLCPAFCLFLYFINQYVLTRMVMFMDSLYKPSTYTPFLGDLGEIIDFADQNGWLPDIGSSSQFNEMAMTISTSNIFMWFGLLITTILIGIGFYRLFHLEQYSMRSIFLFHFIASVVTVITSFIFTSKALEIDDDGMWSVFPILALVILFVFVKRCYSALKQLKLD